MGNVLIVVDMQNDFVLGPLSTKEARKIVPNVVRKIKEFEGNIICTKDTHHENYLQTQEGKLLPVEHCIVGTVGHDLCDDLIELEQLRQAPVYIKETFACMELAQMLASYLEPVDEVELVGVCTDICVVSNALLLKAMLPETEIVVDASCCAGVTPELHRAALNVMKSCQIIIRNDEEKADEPAEDVKEDEIINDSEFVINDRFLGEKENASDSLYSSSEFLGGNEPENDDEDAV